MAPSPLPAARAIENELGHEAIDLAALAGLELDPWQQLCMHGLTLSREDHTFWNPYTHRHEQKWATFEAGLMLSRQNGKNSILEARELAGLFIFGERLILHTAHQFDTSMEAFERIMMLIENTPDLDREVSSLSHSHGNEGVTLKSGQRLRFKTRTKGGIRGFSADCVIYDEAMYLSSLQVGASMPTLSARPNPQLIYTGSAGDRNSTQFGRVRSRAIKGGDPRLFYAEWSIEPCGFDCGPNCTEHDDPYTPASYVKANPGMGIRISLEHVEAEARSMDRDIFLQERLGVGDWPVEGDAWKIIAKDRWDARSDETSELVGKFALAIDTAPDRSWSAIGICGLDSEDRTHVEITGRELEGYDYRPGIQWVVPRVKKIWQAQKPEFVVIDKASEAGALIDELEAAGIKVISPQTREYAQACGDFKTGVAPKQGEVPTIIHLNQAPLTTAVANADKRDLMDLWAWSKALSSSDITPLVAVTLAAWGFKKHVYKKASAPWASYR